MRVIFCADPLDKRQTDSAYAAEASAARETGFDVGLINFEALVYENDARQAVRTVAAASEPEPAFYRGWMLTGEQCAALYEALLARNVTLINDPAQYAFAHYLPENYPCDCPADAPDGLGAVGRRPPSANSLHSSTRFGSSPLILKDYVKSRKHEWHEACFIPFRLRYMEAVERVVTTFVRRQGDDLNGGLVFREFVLVPAFDPAPAERDAFDEGVPRLLPGRRAGLRDALLGRGRLSRPRHRRWNHS